MKNVIPLGNSPEMAAAKIGCSRAKLFMELRAGRLACRKMGRRTIILDDDIRQYLQNLPMRRVDTPGNCPPAA